MPHQLITGGPQPPRDRKTLRQPLQQAFPIGDSGSFANLLQAIDEVQRKTRR